MSMSCHLDCVLQQHTWWVDWRVYSELTRPWFHRTLPFPLSYYIPVKKHKDVFNRLFYDCHPDTCSEQDREAQVSGGLVLCLELHIVQTAFSSDFILNEIIVTWFCYQLIAKPGNKTAAPS